MENTKPRIIYEFETQRTNISPKAFYSWVCREFKRRTGEDFMWLDNYETWANPFQPHASEWKEDGRTVEICKSQPFDFQYLLKDAYNFIIEFQFWDENSGNGYCYIVEFER